MIAAAICAAAIAAPTPAPIALHPDNPRYFLFRGTPTVLVTSAEHYGAVLNLDMDHARYLDALKADGLNYTRVFTGAYCEDPKAFNIRFNTLAPAPGRLACPWARSGEPGYASGGAKFDLSRWDEAYFARLTSFVKEAGRRGIVVEVSLFCPFYDDSMWRLSPMNSANNVNRIGTCGREEVYALKEEALTHAQTAMARKVVSELNRFDNVFFEICNEPYFGGVTAEWQRLVSAAITDAEARMPARHLIAQNIANGSARVTNPDPNVQILNFHYAHPPTAVAENASLKRPIGCDETGFQGTRDEPYRRQGWDFMLAGGALYNNLDYSFTTARPDGTQVVTDPTPGGGGPGFRKQMAILLRFMRSLPLTAMAPDSRLVTLAEPTGVHARVLSKPNSVYALYVYGGDTARVTLALPPGRYRVEWTHPLSGEKAVAAITASGAGTVVAPPFYPGEAAVIITRAKR